MLDGWWAEAFDDRNGWALPEKQAPDEEAQDTQDATAFYELVERAKGLKLEGLSPKEIKKELLKLL